MSRNGSGTFTTINTFTPSTTAVSSDVNENFEDVGDEITNSLAIDGQSTMTGQFKAANGTKTAPGISFGSDPDSGVYRIGSNNLGVSCGDTKILDIATTGLTVVGNVDATSLLQGGGALVPAGVVRIWPSAVAPTGNLLCDGASYLRATYPALFTEIGTTYGAADGTHFNVPDLTGRTVFGKEGSATRIVAGSGITSTALGNVGGASTHTLTSPGEIPAHSHGVTDPTHTHAGDINSSTYTAGSGGAVVAVGGAGISAAGTNISIQNTGSGGAHNNMPPTLIMNWIIKT